MTNTSGTDRHPYGHVWHMTSQEGRRCEWECECGAKRTTFDGKG